jgi:hypothetical protein
VNEVRFGNKRVEFRKGEGGKRKWKVGNMVVENMDDLNGYFY